jgi:RNA polymerase sigma-70 factor (ECF subfamily)
MRSRPKHVVEARDGVIEGATGCSAMSDAPPDQDRLLFSAQVRARVAETLTTLSAAERAAFVLRHFEGRSIKEIGHALGLGTSATKHSVFRAVQKVRATLEPIVTNRAGN